MQPATSPHTPARQRRKESRPGELLDAALDLFVEKGFANTRIEEVAARAGVSKGTLYLYFPSKEELLKAVIRHNLSLTIAEGDDLADNFQGSTAELISMITHGWWERVGKTQASGIFLIMMTEMRAFPALAEFYRDEVILPGQRLVGKILQRGIDRGEFCQVDVPVTAKSFIFPMLLLCMHKHSFNNCSMSDEPEDPQAFLANHVELMVHGLRPRPRGDAAAFVAVPVAEPRAKSVSSSAPRKKTP
ncbi:TetR/AcrR family transcriptional regulator [soil metagenome]